MPRVSAARPAISPSHHASPVTPRAPTGPAIATDGSASARAHAGAEVVVEQLAVLVHEHERLEVVVAGEVLERLVVGLVDRAVGLQLGEDRSRLHRAVQPRGGEARQLLLGGDAGGERDHVSVIGATAVALEP